MSMMVSFVLSFFPRDVLDEILNLIESVSEDFPSYSVLVSLTTYFFCEYIYKFGSPLGKTLEIETARMDDLRFYVLFNSIPVISGR